MSITKVTTHNQDALDRLLYQYQDSARLKSLITALFGTQVQEIENALWQLFHRLDIDNSEGVQLDKIGTIVGQSRLGLDDDRYRLLLKAKIAQNVSEGDIERVISVWRLFNPSAGRIWLVEYFPAEVAIYSDKEVDMPFELVTEAGDAITTEWEDTLVAVFETYSLPYIHLFMQRVVGAGVKFSYFAVFNPDNAFAFEGAAASGGFGDVTDPDAGGEFSSIEFS